MKWFCKCCLIQFENEKSLRDHFEIKLMTKSQIKERIRELKDEQK